MSDDVDIERLREICEAYSSDVTTEVEERWYAWKTDLGQSALHEVVGGLLSRQATLAAELVTQPNLWTGHLAPLVLRSMGDVYINLAWIAAEPKERAEKFVEYGLGQVKVLIEHYNAKLESCADEEILNSVRGLEQWVNSQRYSLLVEVNVGAWSERSIRSMADEAGIMEFYNFSYVPFSAAVHSSWHHIERYNLEHCLNPLHRFHRVPGIKARGWDLQYPLLAAKYFSKCAALFDSTFDVSVACSASYERFSADIAGMADSPDDTDEPG